MAKTEKGSRRTKHRQPTPKKPVRRTSRFFLLLGLVMVVPVAAAIVYIQFFGPEKYRVNDIRDLKDLIRLRDRTETVIKEKVREAGTRLDEEVIPAVKDRWNRAVEIAAAKLRSWKLEKKELDERLERDETFRKELDTFEKKGVKELEEEITSSLLVAEVGTAPPPSVSPDPQPEVEPAEPLKETPMPVQETPAEAEPEPTPAAVGETKPSRTGPIKPKDKPVRVAVAQPETVDTNLPGSRRRTPAYPVPQRSAREKDTTFLEAKATLAEGIKWYRMGGPNAGDERNRNLKQALVRLDIALELFLKCEKNPRYKRDRSYQIEIKKLMEQTDFLRYACMKHMTL